MARKPKTDAEYLEGQKGFLFVFEWANLFEKLSNEDSGLLIKALIKYARSGQLPIWANDSTRLAVTFDLISPIIDKNKKEYIKKCKQNSENRQSGWNKEKGKDNTSPNYDSDAYKEKASNPQYIPKN